MGCIVEKDNNLRKLAWPVGYMETHVDIRKTIATHKYAGLLNTQGAIIFRLFFYAPG